MADFCRQCAKELCCDPLNHNGDLAGLISKERVDEGYGAVALCEGCGPIVVDHKGVCQSADCSKNGHMSAQ